MNSFFSPKSVAVVGASADPRKAGCQILGNMIRLGFRGSVFPVNPREPQVLGLKCYPNLRDIPDEVELMVVAIPAHLVVPVFEDARARGDVRAAVIVSAGFSETGDTERIAMEKRVLEIAKGAHIRVLGPNCVGVMNTSVGLDTSFAPSIKQVPGALSILTQSGSLGASILMFDGDQPAPLGFSKFGHVGNMADVDMQQVLEFFGEDSSTKVIGMYLEGVPDAREFMGVARRVGQEKPVLALKVGRTSLGSRAAFSHTGSMAGSDAVYEGALAQSGILRVRTIEELLDTAKALSMQPLPRGNRVCIMTEAGGMGITAMDALMGDGEAQMASLSPETVERLRRILPPMAVVNRPEGYIDTTAAANEEQHGQAMEAVLSDPGVDGVVLLSVPPTFLSPVALAERVVEAAVKAADKPILSCLLAGEWVRDARRLLETNRLPTFDMPDRVAVAMSNMIKRRRLLSKILEKPVVEVSLPDSADFLKEAIEIGTTEFLARRLLQGCGIDVGTYAFVRTSSEAKGAAEEMGYPVVAKVVSPQVVHKTEAGGVLVGIESADELESAIARISTSVTAKVPGAHIDGYLLTPQAKPGHEFIIGAVRDPQMGPVVMFGMGGVFTEVFSDTVFRMAPVTIDTALDMISSIRFYRVLQGYRGSAPVDLQALAECIVRTSEIIAGYEWVSDIEMNPVRIDDRGSLAVLDARLGVRPGVRHQ